MEEGSVSLISLFFKGPSVCVLEHYWQKGQVSRPTNCSTIAPMRGCNVSSICRKGHTCMLTSLHSALLRCGRPGEPHQQKVRT